MNNFKLTFYEKSKFKISSQNNIAEIIEAKFK